MEFIFSLIELVNERTTFGRSGDCDCNISDLFDNEKLIEISGRHFTITKQNIKDALCPVFLEVNRNILIFCIKFY